MIYSVMYYPLSVLLIGFAAKISAKCLCVAIQAVLLSDVWQRFVLSLDNTKPLLIAQLVLSHTSKQNNCSTCIKDEIRTLT